MNKKLFVLILITIMIFANLSYATIVYMGDTFESGDKTITVVKISQNNAVFDVEGVKNIILKGEKKTINGVNIEVMNVFYVDEPESRNVDIAVSGTVSGTTSSTSNTNAEEEDTSGDECWQASDCDDNNPETTDLCMGTPKKCKNLIIKECETSEDCNDDNKCTRDECKNNECFNTKLSDCTVINKETETKKTTEEGSLESLTGDQEKQGFFTRVLNFFMGLFGA